MDRVTLDRIQTAHPKLIDELGKIYGEICEALTGRATCRFTHVLRTNAEQDELFAIGRTKKGKIVTNARGGYSYHNYGFAVDICLIIDGKTASWDFKKDFDLDGIADWMEIVRIFKKYGWEWGGDWRKFPDAPHFQKTFGLSIADLISGKRP
jgi:peptidoglycan L-alanyl-D-glutamate endopeptidase CwlK